MIAEVSRTLTNMAMISVREENYQGAIKLYRELVVLDRRIGNLQGIAIIRQTMSSIYEHHLTRPQIARRSYPQAPLPAARPRGSSPDGGTVSQTTAVMAGAKTLPRSRGRWRWCYCRYPGRRLLKAGTFRKGHWNARSAPTSRRQTTMAPQPMMTPRS